MGSRFEAEGACALFDGPRCDAGVDLREDGRGVVDVSLIESESGGRAFGWFWDEDVLGVGGEEFVCGFIRKCIGRVFDSKPTKTVIVRQLSGFSLNIHDSRPASRCTRDTEE